MDLKKRLSAIKQKDNKTNNKYITDVIKSDFYYLINNYFETDFEDIEINVDVENALYNISIFCRGERAKTMKVLPE